MKKVYVLGVIISIALITVGFGCRDVEDDDMIQAGPSSTDSTVDRNWLQSECPSVKDGWEKKTTARFEFEPNATSTTPAAMFVNQESQGVRCLYYQAEGEAFDITHSEGRSYGNWQYHYEMEVRQFEDNQDKTTYNQDVVTELINTYCRKGSEVVMPYVLRNGATNERFQCSWPAEKHDETSDFINTNTLISVSDYKDALVITAITREFGRTHFIPPDYSGTQEEQAARGLRAQHEVFNHVEFAAIPDTHERELIDYALDWIDKKQY